MPHMCQETSKSLWALDTHGQFSIVMNQSAYRSFVSDNYYMLIMLRRKMTYMLLADRDSRD